MQQQLETLEKTCIATAEATRPTPADVSRQQKAATQLLDGLKDGLKKIKDSQDRIKSHIALAQQFINKELATLPAQAQEKADASDQDAPPKQVYKSHKRKNSPEVAAYPPLRIIFKQSHKKQKQASPKEE